MIKFPTSIENNDDEWHYLCEALRWRLFLAALSAAVQHHERHVEPPGPLARAALNPRQASSEEGRQSSDLMCSLRYTLPSSPTTSFSLLWRGVSLFYETRTTPGRVLISRAVSQGQPRIKRGLCLALVGALELLSVADWGILIFYPKFWIRRSFKGPRQVTALAWTSIKTSDEVPILRCPYARHPLLSHAPTHGPCRRVCEVASRYW